MEPADNRGKRVFPGEALSAKCVITGKEARRAAAVGAAARSGNGEHRAAARGTSYSGDGYDPVVARDGTSATMLVLLQMTIVMAFVPLKVTVLLP